MSYARLVIIGVLLVSLSAVSSGQGSSNPAPELRTTGLHADTVLPYSIIPITATDNGSYSEVDTFGVHLSATYCIDGALEPWLIEKPFPPKPPPGVFDFRFTEHRSGSTCLITGLTVHLQEPAKLDTFRVEFQPGEGGYPMRLSWKDAAARIAADWESLVLRDGLTGDIVSVDMKVDTSVVITNPLLNTLFIIGRSFPLGPRYLIQATAGVGGTIQPGGTISIDSGGSRSFTITPSTGYTIGDIVVDGVSQGQLTQYSFTNVAANHTIHATFTAVTYQVDATAGPGGIILPNGPVTITAGGSQIFLVQPSPGFRTADVIVDGVSQGPLTQYSFTNVSANHTIRATFAAITYQIDASAGTGGTISPGGAVSVPWGGNQTFLIQPSPGYHTIDIIVDGVSKGPLTQYAFTNVTANHTIHASFTTVTYQIVATAGAGGTIQPGGTVYIDSGGSRSFTIIPSPGHAIAGLVVDGVNVGPAGAYSFSNVTANHTIHATFAAFTYQIVATAGVGGTILPGGTVSIDSGGSRAFTITPSPGYAIGGILVDGVNFGPVGAYTFTNVTANHTIHANFTALIYQIDVSAGTGGTISPGGPVTVPSGGSQTFLVQPDPGYEADDVIVDGASQGPLTQYSFTNVTANHTIHATFAAFTYQITANAGTGGTISPSGIVRVPPGGDTTFVIKPYPGYRTDIVIVDGVSNGPLAEYSFTNVTAEHVITAGFTPINGGPGSSIVPIAIRDAGTKRGVVAFGVHPNATYCIDGEIVPGLIERELPPKPPSGVFDLRFTEHRTGSACLGAGTLVHLQEPGKLDTFKLEILPGTSGYPVTLSWPGGLASVWTSLTIRDNFGGSLVNVNMLTQTSLAVTHPLLKEFLIIGQTGSPGRTFSIDASAGPGGSISPQGIVTVRSAANQSFTAIPDAGFVVDSITVDGARVTQASYYTFFNVTADHSIRVDFRPGTGAGSGYRTFTASDFALRTPNTKKALYYRFSFQLVNSSLQPATGLRIEFGGSSSTAVEIDNSAPFVTATTPDGQEWNFADGTVAPGDTIVISGTNLRRPANVHRWYWIYHGLNGPIQARFDPPGQRTAYPMPNAANVREELFHGGFGLEGLTVGIPRIDSARYYGWVRMDRGSQLQRSLAQRDRVHTGVARCFDFVRQRKTLSPMAQDNVMFANQAALKFNIRTSLLGVTPLGLRNLVFQDTAPNPLDGMTIGRIAEYADSLLSGYYAGTIHVCESIALLGQVNESIERINAAFAGPMDTVAYATRMILAGVRGVDEVPFLRANPEMDSVAVEWDGGGTLAIPPPELTLIGNYPNPFNPTTTIRFSLPTDAVVSAIVYNQLGQQVAVLHDNEYLSEGEQETDFNASALGSGLYFCRITMRMEGDPDGNPGTGARTETAVVRMLLVK